MESIEEELDGKGKNQAIIEQVEINEDIQQSKINKKTENEVKEELEGYDESFEKLSQLKGIGDSSNQISNEYYQRQQDQIQNQEQIQGQDEQYQEQNQQQNQIEQAENNANNLLNEQVDNKQNYYGSSFKVEDVKDDSPLLLNQEDKDSKQLQHNDKNFEENETIIQQKQFQQQQIEINNNQQELKRQSLSSFKEEDVKDNSSMILNKEENETNIQQEHSENQQIENFNQQDLKNQSLQSFKEEDVKDNSPMISNQEKKQVEQNQDENSQLELIQENKINENQSQMEEGKDSTLRVLKSTIDEEQQFHNHKLNFSLQNKIQQQSSIIDIKKSLQCRKRPQFDLKDFNSKGKLPFYNSLNDIYLCNFFSNDNIRYHLYNMGLINEQLDILELKKDKRLRIPMSREQKKQIIVPPAPKKMGKKNKKKKKNPNNDDSVEYKINPLDIELLQESPPLFYQKRTPQQEYVKLPELPKSLIIEKQEIKSQNGREFQSLPILSKIYEFDIKDQYESQINQLQQQINEKIKRNQQIQSQTQPSPFNTSLNKSLQNQSFNLKKEDQNNSMLITLQKQQQPKIQQIVEEPLNEDTHESEDEKEKKNFQQMKIQNNSYKNRKLKLQPLDKDSLQKLFDKYKQYSLEQIQQLQKKTKLQKQQQILTNKESIQQNIILQQQQLKEVQQQQIKKPIGQTISQKPIEQIMAQKTIEQQSQKVKKQPQQNKQIKIVKKQIPTITQNENKNQKIQKNSNESSIQAEKFQNIQTLKKKQSQKTKYDKKKEEINVREEKLQLSFQQEKHNLMEKKQETTINNQDNLEKEQQQTQNKTEIEQQSTLQVMSKDFEQPKKDINNNSLNKQEQHPTQQQVISYDQEQPKADINNNNIQDQSFKAENEQNSTHQQQEQHIIINNNMQQDQNGVDGKKNEKIEQLKNQNEQQQLDLQKEIQISQQNNDKTQEKQQKMINFNEKRQRQLNIQNEQNLNEEKMINIKEKKFQKLQQHLEDDLENVEIQQEEDLQQKSTDKNKQLYELMNIKPDEKQEIKGDQGVSETLKSKEDKLQILINAPNNFEQRQFDDFDEFI